jgi:hypothetical protein
VQDSPFVGDLIMVYVAIAGKDVHSPIFFEQQA